MNTIFNKLRKHRDRQVERAMGYLGLFVIGAVSWGSERFSRVQTPVASESHQA